MFHGLYRQAAEDLRDGAESPTKHQVNFGSPVKNPFSRKGGTDDHAQKVNRGDIKVCTTLNKSYLGNS